MFEKIIQKAKTFSLTEAEKKEILRKAVLFRDEHSVHSVPSPFFPWLSILSKNRLAPLMFLFLLILGGGTSLAANFALPGDLLYPIKTHINEKMESVLTFGANANAKLQTDFAGRRLAETEKLAEQGEVSEQATKEIKQSFNTHAKATKKLVQSLKEQGEVEAAERADLNLENSLLTHSAIISNIANSDEKNKQNLEDVNSEIHIFLKKEDKEKKNGDNSFKDSNGLKKLGL